jgi:acetolactate synthase small subunit
MQGFHIRYRNSQGTLMRILNATSRRGIDLTSVHAGYDGQHYSVMLRLDVSLKQIGQLSREWHSIVDVIDVRSTAGWHEHAATWTPHPPASAGMSESARAALA